MSKQSFFFATRLDIENVLLDFEKSFAVDYHLMGLFDEQQSLKLSSLFDDPDLGYTLAGDWNYTSDYIALSKTTELIIRSAPQNNGGVKYEINLMLNPKGVAIKIGGIYKNKEQKNIIVAGRVGTISLEPSSLELYSYFSNRIRKNFKKIDSFYVGKEAERKMDEGWRLLTSIGSPAEYDLKK